MSPESCTSSCRCESVQGSPAAKAEPDFARSPFLGCRRLTAATQTLSLKRVFPDVCFLNALSPPSSSSAAPPHERGSGGASRNMLLQQWSFALAPCEKTKAGKEKKIEPTLGPSRPYQPRATHRTRFFLIKCMYLFLFFPVVAFEGVASTAWDVYLGFLFLAKQFRDERFVPSPVRRKRRFCYSTL